MTPYRYKDIKKGDVFYSRGGDTIWEVVGKGRYKITMWTREYKTPIALRATLKEIRRDFLAICRMRGRKITRTTYPTGGDNDPLTRET